MARNWPHKVYEISFRSVRGPRPNEVWVQLLYLDHMICGSPPFSEGNFNGTFMENLKRRSHIATEK